MIQKEYAESKPCVKELETSLFVKTNRNLFEDVAEKFGNFPKSKDTIKYTVLDYHKILNEMCEYLTGYKDYATKGSHKYDGKVLAQTNTFYNNMFDDKKSYRKTIRLADFPDVSEEFLVGTQKLQGIIQHELNKKEISSEMKQLITMTNNQYRKVAKVHKDDMNIYLWLASQKSTMKFMTKHDISTSTRDAFNNQNTPVMHKVRKWVDDE